MSVAFISQTAVAYKSTSIIEWYGSPVVGYITRYFVNAIDFSFDVGKTDFTQAVNKVAHEFEVILVEFGIIVKAIDFTNKVKPTDYDMETNLIQHSQEIS